jgi:3-oxoacyl-(acyl-carrier-protein) synthase
MTVDAVQNIPSHKNVYISSETRTTVTISGPPSILKEFIASDLLSGTRTSSMPIFGAFHASHLAAPPPALLAGLDSSNVFQTPVPASTILMSPSTGVACIGTTLSDLMQEAVAHIFQEKLFPTKAIEAALVGIDGAHASLTIFGPSNAENFLNQALKTAGLEGVKVQATDKSSAHDISDAYAIVGMSGRFPGSDTLYGFWNTLVQNKDLCTKVPIDRWDTDLHLDPTGKTPNTALSAFGCFLDNPGMFDNLLFNMSPREAMQTDPMQRLLLMATYEALEMSGYRYDVKSDNNARVGTYMGMTADDWREYNISQEIDMYFVTGGLRAFGSGRLNYFFKFDGPSYVVDTACSSSGAAIELACAALQAGVCDMAIAGGANVMSGPNLWAGLSRAGFTSPTGSCKTFDETADGYCRGDAIGVVVIKRLADAVAEGDNIIGVIRSIATNHSAHAPSITQPYSPAQVSLYKEVLRKAGVTPDKVGYVEAHGTGTQAGDTTEITSVVATFGSGRKQDNPLYVGGVKANIGHGEGVSFSLSARCMPWVVGCGEQRSA